MKIFFRLLLSHLLTDFTLQNNFIAGWKRKKFIGVVVHSTFFLILSFIFTYGYLNKIWFDYPIKLNGVWCLLILFLLHVIEDEYRAYNVRHYHINDTILFFLWDQIIHIVFLFVFSPYREGEPEPLVVILCLLVIGTHATSIFILYTDILAYGKSIAHEFFRKKYFSIILRGVIMILFILLGKYYLVTLILLPIKWFINKKYKYLTNTGWVVSTVFTYIIGFGIVKLLGRI